jgi:hypothetical protein
MSSRDRASRSPSESPPDHLDFDRTDMGRRAGRRSFATRPEKLGTLRCQAAASVDGSSPRSARSICVRPRTHDGCAFRLGTRVSASPPHDRN